jgi:hypothetical protein
MDDQPDLVDVADHGHERPAPRAADARHGRADGVVGDLGERARRLAEHGGRGLLIARRPRGGQELAQRVWQRHEAGQLS